MPTQAAINRRSQQIVDPFFSIFAEKKKSNHWGVELKDHRGDRLDHVPENGAKSTRYTRFFNDFYLCCAWRLSTFRTATYTIGSKPPENSMQYCFADVKGLMNRFETSEVKLA